jgi:hypothetical protein
MAAWPTGQVLPSRTLAADRASLAALPPGDDGGAGCRVAARGPQARRLAWVSLAWICTEGAVGLWQGLAAESIALTGWALGSVVEGLASAIAIWRFTGTRTVSENRRAARPARCRRLVLAAGPLDRSRILANPGRDGGCPAGKLAGLPVAVAAGA